MHLVNIDQNLTVLGIVSVPLIVQQAQQLGHSSKAVTHGHCELNEHIVVSG